MSQPPDKGQMYLFDSATPPLEVGSYQVTAETDVTFAGTTQPYTQSRYFDVVGPRFSIPQAMVAGVFPPANAHGSFQDSLPHIVLSRRTLPWERDPDPSHHFPAPVTSPAEPPLAAGGPTPWVALLLFEEGEYTLYNNIPLQQAVPAAVFQRMGSPAGITCDAVEATRTLVESILPSIEELQLLAHVRWVNVDDRELNIGGGDGYFSVVVSNRLPSGGAQCRAVLVSLEERADLVSGDPGKSVDTGPLAGGLAGVPVAGLPVAATRANLAVASNVTESGGAPVILTLAPVLRTGPNRLSVLGSGFVQLERVRLIALTSWKFTCEGPGTFESLMQGLDVAMFGTVADTGHPPLSDTGHLQLELQDRAGGTEQVWYRGPLVQYQLTRDPLGPYHCADQARRVTPETGAEDISYAAAFEVGRLLAAADARLAQSLMKWRREAYKQAARTDTLNALAARLPMQLPATLADRLHTPIAPLAAAAATASVVQSAPLLADAHGLSQVAGLPGLNPNTLAAAWQLASPAQASALLTGSPQSLAGAVTAGPTTPRPPTTLATEAADAAGLARLSAQRNQALQNAVSKLENS